MFGIDSLKQANASFYDGLRTHLNDQMDSEVSKERALRIARRLEDALKTRLLAPNIERAVTAAKEVEAELAQVHLALPAGCLDDKFHTAYLEERMSSSATQDAYMHYSTCKRCLGYVFTQHILGQ